MNLINLSASLRKYLWLVPFILVLIFVGLLLLYRSLQNVTQIEPVSKIDATYLSVNSKLFDTSNLKIEGGKVKKLPVYTVTSDKNFLENINDLKSILQINGQETDIKESIFKNGKQIISKDGAALQVFRNYFSISRPGSKSDEQASFISTVELQEKTRAFFEELSLPMPQDYQITYTHFTSELSFEDKLAEAASFINLRFNQTLDKTRVYSPNNRISSSFNKAGDLIIASYNNLKAEPKAVYPLIDVRKALTSFTQYTQPVKIYGEGEIYLKTNQLLDNVKLTNTYLAYFYPDAASEKLSPVWVFEGEGTVSGKKLYLEYVVDAIKENFLK